MKRNKKRLQFLIAFVLIPTFIGILLTHEVMGRIIYALSSLILVIILSVYASTTSALIAVPTLVAIWWLIRYLSERMWDSLKQGARGR